MKFQQPPDKVLQTEVDAGLALLDPNTNTYFLLNQTGASIWAELEEEKSLDELCAAIAAQFDVSPSGCRDDVKGMLDALTGKGLIVSRNEGSD